MKVFEDSKDCSPVEKFIWNKLTFNYGEFEGIKELSLNDLYLLKLLILRQIKQKEEIDKKELSNFLNQIF